MATTHTTLATPMGAASMITGFNCCLCDAFTPYEVSACGLREYDVACRKCGHYRCDDANCDAGWAPIPYECKNGQAEAITITLED